MSRSTRRLTKRRARAKQKKKDCKEHRNASGVIRGQKKREGKKTLPESGMPGFRPKTVKKAEKGSKGNKQAQPSLLTRIIKHFRKESRSVVNKKWSWQLSGKKGARDDRRGK